MPTGKTEISFHAAAKNNSRYFLVRGPLQDHTNTHFKLHASFIYIAYMHRKAFLIVSYKQCSNVAYEYGEYLGNEWEKYILGGP